MRGRLCWSRMGLVVLMEGRGRRGCVEWGSRRTLNMLPSAFGV